MHAGQQEPKQAVQTRNFKSAIQPRVKELRSLFPTMNSSHADLINSLRKTERLTDKTSATMLQVDRKYFFDPDNSIGLQQAYQVTAQAFHAVCIMQACTLWCPSM